MSLSICLSRTSIEANTEAVLRSSESFKLLSISNLIFWKKLLDSFDVQNDTLNLTTLISLINKNIKSGNNRNFKQEKMILCFSYKTKAKSI